MNHQEKTPKKTLVRELIALHLISNLGARRIRMLIQAAGHPQDIFRMNRRELQSIHGIGPKTAEQIVSFDGWSEVDRILQKTERIGAVLMTLWDEDYPPLLREIYDSPLLLWIKGNRRALQTDSVAIVGTRKAGRYGRDAARLFARELSKRGLTITSGLAYGIDGAAHRATVAAGGCTVGVLGSGIDIIYPAAHKKLAADIIDTGGAIISEFPVGTDPDAGNFPVRNRIVSGLSLGTLVVASGIAGGSMITAKLALDQNREVFVVPHPIGTPNAIGCNNLIQRGMGKLVQDVEDILEEIEVHISKRDSEGREEEPGEDLDDTPRWRSLELDELSADICKTLQGNPLHIDDLAERLGVEPHKLLPTLLELELQECVRQMSGKNFELGF
ncbi:DNA processing protein [Fodinibius roseus]|uniref:DNA processing protein n=1 Tax=Fodinibius roseus TaxID=1194090 RepID=A0A1M5GEX2_9BACT|nr:DNA-processing protein DprA [Fodinibius roseus]SHG02273.1 DNA processing protein [Fodinibius roseus]